MFFVYCNCGNYKTYWMEAQECPTVKRKSESIKENSTPRSHKLIRVNTTATKFYEQITSIKTYDKYRRYTSKPLIKAFGIFFIFKTFYNLLYYLFYYNFLFLTTYIGSIWTSIYWLNLFHKTLEKSVRLHIEAFVHTTRICVDL